MITAGGADVEVELGRLRRRASRPGRRGRILTTIWPGVTERSTSWPTAFLGDLFDEIPSDRQRDVGLEQGDAHLAHGRAHVGLA